MQTRRARHATRMACASPAEHAHEASTQQKERHKYNSPIHVRTKVACAQSLSEYRTRGKRVTRVVATREGEVGRGEDGDRDREANDGRGLVERPVSADRVVGLDILTAHAADKDG